MSQDLPTSSLGSQSAKLQAALIHLTAIFIFIGAGLMKGGQSAATHDITYLHTGLTCIIGTGNVGIVSSVALLCANLGVLVPLMAFLIYKTVFFQTNIVFLVLSNVSMIFVLIVMEKQYRNQFLEHHVALFMKARQVQRGKEREALLASMVPEHIVKDLMTWMVTMDPTRPIVQKLPMVCVGFFQTYQPELRSESFSYVDALRSNIAAEVKAPACGQSGVLAVFGAPERSVSSRSPSPVAGADPPSEIESPLAAIEGGGRGEDCAVTAGTNGGDANNSFSARRSSGDPVVAMKTQHTLQEIHSQIDALLKHLRAVSKIKSIGDYVMLAGPFDVDGKPQWDIAEACDDMLAAAHLISFITPCRVGLHVGEVVGAVLGTSRLCYDVFGDSVNTASRVMSSGLKGSPPSVSEVFYKAHPASTLGVLSALSDSGARHDDDVLSTAEQFTENTTSHGDPRRYSPASRQRRSDGAAWRTIDATFSEEPIEVVAKGKGVILTRQVLWTPALDLNAPAAANGDRDERTTPECP